MADVFVSYAKTDRSLASTLVAMLEAEGWKVWWDTSLTIGDDFRNEIMIELGRARAVVVIWTDASIKSDWVRSEAGRAQADRKLIPVKLEHLTYKDLPPPFDVLHTENVSEDDKIRAAVVAQLAKPAVEPSAWALLTKGFRYELLTWVGIVGGALTLFTNLRGVLQLADWARVLVENWREWSHAFWLWAFGWLGIHLSPEWTPILSFVSFGSFLAIGQAVKFNTTITNVYDYTEKAFQVISRRTLLCVVSIIACIGLSYFVLYFIRPSQMDNIALIIIGSSLALGLLILPQIIIVLFARHKLHAALSVCLTSIFWAIIAVYPLAIALMSEGRTSEGFWAPGTFLSSNFIIPLILLSVAPAKAVSRRLIFLALGLILLIALNELSKLGLDVTAPKLQG
jgi:hypothetical protein